jgi:hypothetical protein
VFENVGQRADLVDVNILAAPALDIPGVDHVVAVVCGTGTVGRTIRIDKAVSTQSSPGLEGVDAPVNGGGKIRRLPLEDVAVARGWGYLYVCLSVASDRAINDDQTL